MLNIVHTLPMHVLEKCCCFFFFCSLNFCFHQLSLLIAKLIANYLYLLSMDKIERNRTNIENVLKK